MTWRYVPLAGVVLFLAIAACWRPLLQLRRYGALGVVIFRSGSFTQNAHGLGLVVLFVLLSGQAVVAATRPEALSPLGLLPSGWVDLFRITGAILMFGAIALLVTAQLELGASWRIGIDEGAKPGLVTSGLYRMSRNPIFLAILLFVVGYGLMLPTGLSLALLIGCFVGIREQTLAEEAYLLRTYGEAYRAYARRVGRFVPGLGKLA